MYFWRMNVVVEAGGTKTEVRFVQGGEVLVESGQGINPYFQTDDELAERMAAVLKGISALHQYVYYYGAGCGSENQRKRVHRALAALLPEAQVEVAHDLLGTARALCGDQPGFAGILGTGSNGCVFDGQCIVNQMVSLGFWLGDEGSGGYIGKMLFTHWLKDAMPAELQSAFEAQIKLAKKDALQVIYADTNANKTLGSMAAFAFSNRGNHYIETVLNASLAAYFQEVEHLLAANPGGKVHFSGSVAHLLAEDLKQQILNRGFEPGHIVANPSGLLFQYHQNNHAQ